MRIVHRTSTIGGLKLRKIICLDLTVGTNFPWVRIQILFSKLNYYDFDTLDGFFAQRLVNIVYFKKDEKNNRK